MEYLAKHKKKVMALIVAIVGLFVAISNVTVNTDKDDAVADKAKEIVEKIDAVIPADTE